MTLQTLSYDHHRHPHQPPPRLPPGVVAACQHISPKNLQAVMLFIQQKMFDGFGILEDDFSKPRSGTVAGAEPDDFWRNAVFELDVEVVFIEGEDGVEVVLPGVLEDFEIVEIRQA